MSPAKILFILALLVEHHSNSKSQKQTQVNCQVRIVISSFPISTERLKQLEVETLNDKALQRVAIYIAQRWLKSRNQLNPELKPYYLSNEFIIVINLILKGSKIVTTSILNTLIPYILAT